jgi:hypothetical protein
MRPFLRVVGMMLLVSQALLPLDAVDSILELISRTDGFKPGGDDGLVDQSLKANASVDAAFDNGLFLGLAGFLEFTIDSADGISGDLFSGDLTALFLGREFSGSRSDALRLSVGREKIRDFSGLILDAPADGLRLEYRRSELLLGVQTGSSGLLLDGASPYLATPSEALRSDPLFGPSRFVSRLNLELEDFLPRQLLNADFLINVDLPEDGEYGGDIFDSFTLGLGLTGTLYENIFYAAFLFGQQSAYYGGDDREYLYTRGLASSAGFSIAADLSDSRASRIEFSSLFASGDGEHPLLSDSGGGLSTQFSTLTDAEPGFVYPLLLSNLVQAEAGYSLAPVATLEELRIKGTAAFIMRPCAGSGTMAEIPASGAPAGYLGTEFCLSSDIELSPGFFVGFEGGLFLPGSRFIDAGIFSSDGPHGRLSLTGRYVLPLPLALAR